MVRHSYRVSFWQGPRSPFEGSAELHVAQGQGRRVLDGFERETGAHVFEFNRCNQAFVHQVIGVNVRDDDAHQVVYVAAHPVDFGDLGNVADGFDEFVEPRFAVVGGFQGDKDRGAEVQRPGIEQGHGLFDHSFFFQALDAAPARGLGQADAIRERRGSQAAILLEEFQNFTIQLIHATLLSEFRFSRNFVAQRVRGRRMFATG